MKQHWRSPQEQGQPSPAPFVQQQTAAGLEQQGGDAGHLGIQQAVHPAEALMPLVDCLLTALQYRHCLHLQE